MSHTAPNTYAVNLNPAGLPEGKEFKYERVEKAKVDGSGHAQVVDIREDKGGEDPGMNFKDKRPDVPPGTPIGVVPSSVTESGIAPEVPKSVPGPFIAEDEHSGTSHDATIVGHLPNDGRTVKKTTEVEEKVTNNPESASIKSGSSAGSGYKHELPSAGGVAKKEVHERVTSTAPDSVSTSMRSGYGVSPTSEQEVTNKVEKTSIHDVPTGKTDPEYQAKTEQKVKDDGRKVTKTEETVTDDQGHAKTKKKFEEATPDESRV